MASPKLTDDQRETLLTWIAAEYSPGLILKWMRQKGWPEITKEAVSYYRTTYGPDIERLRKERRETALERGLALKEEQVARLVEHADKLESIKWKEDFHGKMHNEKAWRDTLIQIAILCGFWKKTVELTGKDGGPIEIDAGAEIRRKLDRLAAASGAGESDQPAQ